MQAEELPGTRNAMPAAPGLVRAKVTERMVASLSPARPVRAASVAPGAGPLWRPLVPLSATALALQHGLAPLDASGRLYEARVFTALGWGPGTVVSVADHPRGLLLTRSAAGPGPQLDRRGRLKLPLAQRRRLRVGVGDPVWLAADTDAGLVLVSSCAALDALARTLFAVPSPGAAGTGPAAQAGTS
jgi:hypothetical protein